MWLNKHIWQQERGGILIQAVIFLSFVALFVTGYAGFLYQAQQSAVLNWHQRQAAYNAWAGIEYAIKKTMLLPSNRSGWQETVVLDANSRVRLVVEIKSNGWITIQATGLEPQAVFRLKATYQQVDLQNYAVLTTGSVEGVRVTGLRSSSASQRNIKGIQQLSVLPLFDVQNEQFQSASVRFSRSVYSPASEDDDDDPDDGEGDEDDDDDDSDGHHAQDKSPVRIFTGKWVKTPVITGTFIQLVTPPRGKARWIPFLVYQPRQNSHFEIATRGRVKVRGILVVNGNISRKKNASFQPGTLEITANKKVIRKIYRKYSVNEAPVLIRNLQVYSI